MTGTLLRLRADTYYVPVRDGVWIRTTDGSFTLRGATVARWVERLAPMFDRGVVPDQLIAELRPDQAEYVRNLVGVLERRDVLRREPAPAADPTGPFAQQHEFLRHFTDDPAAALAEVRRHPVAVAGPPARAAQLAAALIETGFGDVALLDCEPTPELVELAAECGERGAPVRLTVAPTDRRDVVAVFAPEESDLAWRLVDRAAADGVGAWVGVVRGQAMLLKGQLPGSGLACVRCAWRRLVHTATALPSVDGLGHVPTSVAAAVLAQELFQWVGGADPTRLSEGVVVDLTRLSVWRTAVDPDPTCPADHGPSVLGARGGTFPEVVFGARCFGPLVSCSPGDLTQLPLAALRLRCNVPGRDGPAAAGDGPVVVARTVPVAREEAVLLAVEASLAGRSVVGVGRDRAEAVGRALVRLAETTGLDGWTPASEPAPADPAGLAGLVDDLPEVRLRHHPSGLWQAIVGSVGSVGSDDGAAPSAGLDAAHARERALLRAIAARQLPVPATEIEPAPGTFSSADASAASAGSQVQDDSGRDLTACAAALGLACRPLPLPPLVSAHLVGVELVAAERS